MKFQVFVWRVASDLFLLFRWCGGADISVSTVQFQTGVPVCHWEHTTLEKELLHTFIILSLCIIWMRIQHPEPHRSLHPLERIGLLSVLKLSSITASISRCRTVPHLAGGEARCGTVARKSRAVRFRARVMACSWSCFPFSCAVCRLKSFEYIWQRWKSRGTRLWYWIACKGGEVQFTVSDNFTAENSC